MAAAKETVFSPRNSMPLSPENALLNKYELIKLIGRGAFAKVYLAKEISTGESVAIKVFDKTKLKISTSSNLTANIKREISIMSKLRHPNIVKLIEVLATKTKIYFVLEFVTGGELFAKVAKGRFNEDHCRKVFRQLISALSHCHALGIYHRDLKPENLLLDENGDVKVSDFGLSALSDQIQDDGLLHTLCGTPAYVAPEIVSKKGYDGAKIDVWSSGVVLFVMAAGFLPFQHSNVTNMYKKIYKGEYKCPKWISPGMKRFLSRLLDANPNTRITIDEIKRDPWFNRGYGAICSGRNEALLGSTGNENLRDMNAFDIISLSSGLDLSGLFNTKPLEDVERLTAEGPPEKVMERVEEAVKAEQGGVRWRAKKDCAVEVEGQNGDFIIGLEVYRLTSKLVVVEVKRKAGERNAFGQLSKDKIRPYIMGDRERLISGY